MRNRKSKYYLIVGVILFSVRLSSQSNSEGVYTITQEGREYFGCNDCFEIEEEVCDGPLRSGVQQIMNFNECVELTKREEVKLELSLVVAANGRILGYRWGDSSDLKINEMNCIEGKFSEMMFEERESGVSCGTYTYKMFMR